MNFGEYTPNPMQQAMLGAFAKGDPVISVRCDWGSGKSTAIAMMCEAVAQARPGTTMLLATDTPERLRHVLHPALEEFLQPLGWMHWAGAWLKSQTRSAVVCVALDSPSGLVGAFASSGVALLDNCQSIDPVIADSAHAEQRSRRD